jgi:hypothetical protein
MMMMVSMNAAPDYGESPKGGSVVKVIDGVHAWGAGNCVVAGEGVHRAFAPLNKG